MTTPVSGGAATADVAGYTVVLHYGDAGEEYAALRSGAMLVDRSARGRMRIHGPKASEMVTGLVSNDVGALTPGQGCYAAALTPKGRIVADLRIFALRDALLVDAPPRAREGWLGMVQKYINPRISRYDDETATTRQIGIFGARARTALANATGLDLALLGALPRYGHVALDLPAGAMIARVPELELEGYELFVPESAFEPMWERLVTEGATPAGLAAWDIARIEAGRPEWGVDMDESTIPQEANLDDLHAISYTKGCYVGQETVARVHFRGHVNRHLRGLMFPEGSPALMAPARGTALVDMQGKVIGDVRSTALSPRLGSIALGMVRREIEPGTTVQAVMNPDTTERVDTPALIVRLPFAAA
ncbi:MAG: CAF17-like 4Fe-4S cluster assembly/insertion protein YgfZ [Gemmatimonadaceae bacterium]